MTTIAYKSKVLSCDSQLSGEDGKFTQCDKIKKVKGWLIGAAGGWDMCEAFMNRFDPVCVKNKHIALLPNKDNDFEALIISPKGQIYFTEDGGVIGKLHTKGFIAIGSGWKAAMVAMEMGASALDAVKMAMKYDLYTGGRVKKIKL